MVALARGFEIFAFGFDDVVVGFFVVVVVLVLVLVLVVVVVVGTEGAVKVLRGALLPVACRVDTIVAGLGILGWGEGCFQYELVVHLHNKHRQRDNDGRDE